ncbi:LCP family glycopolymer transferase CpsA [Streptococcus didelphis]|uniref:LCP family glycopolymer transferase CpsA n=1 Tax=Streptococcus didelphis TaxID=102886 RepID=UPI00036A795F|nr:LCP family protein [Streptococcus didelphis]
MTRQSRHTQSSTSEPSNSFSMINLVLLSLYTILSVIVIFMMYSYNFLAFRHLNSIVGFLILVLFLLSLILIILKKAKLFTMLSLIISNLILVAMLFTFKSTIDFTAKLNKTASFSEVEMSVVVPKDSPLHSISDVKSLEAPTSSDSSNIDSLLEQIKKDKQVAIEKTEVASYQKAYENLLEGSSQAMVMNQAYISLIEQNHSDYKEKVKTLYSYKIKKEIKTKSSKANKSGVFNVYISGIDTYGPISTVSRSDVNIIMTVNMNTHKVLLTTTPRDSYVKIPDGGGDQYDKLTHAGIYGVETSMKTLENLYNIDINYYARINFTSFITLIDLLGGIEVQNDHAFSAGDYDFAKGSITLNSEQALRFVRERKSLEGGDNDRGKNQEKVIAAIINKLTTIKSPAQFSSIVNGLQNSIQTNLSLNQMMSIANAELGNKDSYNIESQDVLGTGSTGQLPSYAMPASSLYMYKLDDFSLEQAKQKINTTMEEHK